MAFLRLGYIRESKSGNKNKGLYDALAYIFNSKKTENKYVGGYNLIIDKSDCTMAAYEQMMATKEMYGKTGERQAYHYKLSFPSSDSVSPELVMQITKELCAKCFGNYECAYTVHTNTSHLHSHIVFNSVGLHGYKYRYEKGDWKNYIMPEVNRICEKYGLTGLNLEVDEDLQLKYKTKKSMKYNDWMERKGEKSDKNIYTNEQIRKDIDECISRARNYQEFVNLMREKGHIYDDSHKYITVKAPGRTKPARIINLTPDKNTYTKDNIENMILGIYPDRNDVMNRLFADWNTYNNTVKVRFMKKYNLDILRISEEIELISDNKICNKRGLAEYSAYISAADKELNIIRKRIQSSLKRHEAAYAALDDVLDSYDGFVRYKNGDKTFKNSYDRCIDSFEKLSKYDIQRLYEYREKAQAVIKQIEDYKKHIYVNKKIVKRIQQKIQQKIK